MAAAMWDSETVSIGEETQGMERHAPAEARGEGDGVRGEIDVVREEDDVVVCVGVSLREELLRRETIFERRHLEVAEGE